MPDKEELKQARSKAFRYLSYRDRSRHEVEVHLKQKGFSAPVVRDTLEYLKRLNYVNDERFALAWGKARIETRHLGANRLRYELTAKGLDRDLVDKALSALFDDIDEFALARSCAQKKLLTLKGIAPEKKRQRLAQFLQRKGFHSDTVYKILADIAPYQNNQESAL